MALELLKRLQLWEKREVALFANSPAARSSAWPWPWRCSTTRRCCSSTSLRPDSTRRPASKSTTSCRSFAGEQRTILLTTHYIEEAEKLCDRVAIIDEGRIIAIGTPREIQERTLSASTIEIECAQPLAAGDLPAWQDAEKITLDDRRTRICGHVRAARPHDRGHGQVAAMSAASNWRISGSSGPRSKRPSSS